MHNPSHAPPSRHPFFTLAAGALLLGTVLVAAPVPGLPAQFDDIMSWWDRLGTASATIAILRTVGVVLAGWAFVVAVTGLLADRHQSPTTRRLWRWVAPAALRRMLAASTLAAGVSAPGIAVAADTADDAPMLHDLGPAPAEVPAPVPILLDLGPNEAAVVEATSEAPRPSEMWTVEIGDHLWRVAEETLADRGQAAGDAEVAAYSRQIFDMNRGAIGDDPDLIHPGTVLTLP